MITARAYFRRVINDVVQARSRRGKTGLVPTDFNYYYYFFFESRCYSMAVGKLSEKFNAFVMNFTRVDDKKFTVLSFPYTSCVSSVRSKLV